MDRSWQGTGALWRMERPLRANGRKRKQQSEEEPGPSGRDLAQPQQHKQTLQLATNAASIVLRRQLFPSAHRACGPQAAQLRDLLRGKFCATLEPQEIRAPGHDKIFSCAWLDDSSVVFGTKCNRMLVHNLRQNTTREVLPVAAPPEALRPPHAIPANEFGACGIHSIKLNPSGTLITTGGDNVNDAAVYTVQDMAPKKLYLGHQDWVFATAWLAEHQFITGGRDGKLCVWNVDLQDPDLLGGTTPLTVRSAVRGGKVRDLCVDDASGLITTLNPAGSLAIFRPSSMRRLRQVALRDAEDLYCLAAGPNLVAVGSARELLLVDPRKRDPTVGRYEHTDHEGLRSLSFHSHVVACGGSSGQVSFFDLRAGAYVEGMRGVGWQRQAAILLQGGYAQVAPQFSDIELDLECQAIYCQAWDSSGSRLLCCGGPLQYGMRGSYAAVLS